jgi:hypothetical protein
MKKGRNRPLNQKQRDFTLHIEIKQMFGHEALRERMIEMYRCVVLIAAAVLVLIAMPTVECGGSGKSDKATRGGKSVSTELAAAAAEETADAILAATLQAEEDKKVAHNNSGGYSDAAIARDLQAREDEKVSSSKKRKVTPSLRGKSRSSESSANATVSFPGPNRPDSVLSRQSA